MDQWRLILWALFLTLLLPLVLWTGLFMYFGWKLFLILFVVFGLLLMYGDKIIKSPIFKGVVQMLVPFAMTYRFYRGLSAGKKARKQKANSLGAFFAMLRGLLTDEESDAGSKKALEKADRVPKDSEREAAEREAEQLLDDAWPEPNAASTRSRAQADAEDIESPVAQAVTAQRSTTRPKAPNEQELDHMLSQLKQKMGHKRGVRQKQSNEDD